MEYDVVVVGAGPAGLAAAIRLKELKPDTSICVLEKASAIGAQLISGCALEPGPLDALLPGWRETPPDICVPATRDEFWYFSKSGATRLLNPPQMNNHGNLIVSLGQLAPILAARAEALGVDVFPGFAAAEALVEGDRVVGVRIGDMGLDRERKPGPNYAPGADIRAGTTLLAEGARGSITKQLTARLGLADGRQPQSYGLGIKELWQLPAGRAEPGLIQHTIGWPLDSRTYGGSFLYHLDRDRVYVGYVAGLDYEDPRFKPFEAFQQFKHHPKVRPLLEGGEILAYGARTIAAGGWQSLPRMDAPGLLLVGDTAGTLNVPKIKGVHQAIRCGALAAQHLAETGGTAGFEARWRASDGGRELKRVRNIKPGFHRGLWWGLANAALETVTARPHAVDVVAPRESPRAASPRDRARRRPRLGRARPAAARPAGGGLPCRQRARRIAARAPACLGHVDLRDALHHGVRQSLRELLPGQRLRDGGRRRGRPAPADQRRELRALQGLRHQGSLRHHHLDHARRRLGPNYQGL